MLTWHYFFNQYCTVLNPTITIILLFVRHKISWYNSSLDHMNIFLQIPMNVSMITCMNVIRDVSTSQGRSSVPAIKVTALHPMEQHVQVSIPHRRVRNIFVVLSFV